MKIKDMDKETRLLIFWTRAYVRLSTPDRLESLKEAISNWEKVHDDEITENLFRFIFGKTKDNETIQ